MSGAKVYGFLAGEESVTAAKFLSNHTAVLEKILEDPHASILFSDLPGDGGVFIARYLRGHYYRNAVLYHLGDDTESKSRRPSNTRRILITRRTTRSSHYRRG